jgi:hypothetical protein
MCREISQKAEALRTRHRLRPRLGRQLGEYPLHVRLDGFRNGHFSLYIRSYWGKQAILDGSWQPPKIVKTN